MNDTRKPGPSLAAVRPGLNPEETYKVDDLLRVMARLRDPDGGCPWDIKQTFRTIAPHTLEECYELIDAIERNDLPHLAEELGDVMFQVVFYSQLGREMGAFDFESVVDGLVRKLISRHPHVFAEGEIEGRFNGEIEVDQVKANWEAIKQEERNAKQHVGTLADVPVALPALTRAQKLQKRAAGVGFDWSQLSAVIDNLEGEISELREALSTGNADHIADEFGDVLFSAVNVGRHLKLDAESALRAANSKFERRFNAMEFTALAQGVTLSDESSEALEARWRAVKASD